MSFLKSLFSSRTQRATVYEHYIETLAASNDKCEWLKKLSYESSAKYMEEASARVLESGKPFPEESVLYDVIIKGKAYVVRVSRDIQKTGILLTSHRKEDYPY